MQSRISLSSRAILRKNLTRFWPVWFLYTITWLLVLPASIYLTGRFGSRDLSDLQHFVYGIVRTGGAMISFFYAIVLAMCLFSPFYGARSVYTVAALPVRRETQFLTQAWTGLLAALVPNLVVMLLSMASTAAVGLPAPMLCLEWFAITALQFMFFFGLAVLCANLVGSLLFLPILYGILNFAAIILNLIVWDLLSRFVYGISTSYGGSVLSPLSPLVHLLSHSVTAQVPTGAMTYLYRFASWRYLGILAGVGVAFLAVGFLLFRRRHMETVGDVIAVRPLRPVFKYAFTAGCSLVLGFLISSLLYNTSRREISVVGMTLCLLFSGFLGYFGAEMLLKKTFRVWRRGWAGFGIFSLLLVGSVVAMEFDLTGYERRVPEAQEVEQVTFQRNYGPNDAVVLTDPAFIQDAVLLHQRIVSEKAASELLMEQYADRADVLSTNITLDYTLHNGKVLSRQYTLPYSEADARDESSLIRQYGALYNDPAVEEQRYSPQNGLTAADITYGTVDGYAISTENWQSINLTTEQAKALYQDCILPDIRDGLLQTQLVASEWTTAQLDERMSCTISISFERTVPTADGDTNNLGYYLILDLRSGSNPPRTMAFIQELGFLW